MPFNQGIQDDSKNNEHTSESCLKQQCDTFCILDQLVLNQSLPELKKRLQNASLMSIQSLIHTQKELIELLGMTSNAIYEKCQ